MRGGRMTFLWAMKLTTVHRRLVTFNGGLERESPPNPLNLGEGSIINCPDI